MKRAHDQEVALCNAEIQAVLPDLARKHSPPVLVAALSEQVASTLFRTRQSRECTPEQLWHIIQRVRQIAFAH